MAQSVIKTLSLLCFLAAFAHSQYVTVPTDHQVYPLLVKGETMGMFDSYSLRVIPITRSEVILLLNAMKKNADKLSSADAGLVDQMIGEFTDLKIGEPAGVESEIHAYRYEEGSSQIFVDVRGLGEADIHRGYSNFPDENVLKVTGMGSIRGQFGDHIFLDVSARNGMTLGSKDNGERFDVAQGETRSTVGSTVFTDQATGYVAANFGPFSLYLGRTTFSWGSGIEERLALSFLNEPMDQIRMSLDFKSFRFSYFHANLQGIGSPRFLAGHRLDFMLGGGFQMGAYETIVYGGRGAELSYLNPFLVYHFMEHQLGDRDNNTFGIDATYLVTPGCRVFGEVFVDDFSLDHSPFTFWGNKLAATTGFQWAQPLDVRTLEMTGSYTRVDPFVYTHQDSLNVYSHYGSGIGSRIGPNAERYALFFLWRPDRDLFCNLAYSFTREGRGDILIPHKTEDGDEKDFLTGTLQAQHNIAVRLRYQFSRDMFFGVEASLLNERNSQLMSGVNANGNRLRAFLDVNY